jgi:Uma2 family endonuclease
MTMGAPLTVPRRLLTVDQYHKMGEAGVLGEDDRVELIEGELIEMAAIGSRHMAKVNRLARLLIRAVGDQAIVSVQNPISLPPHNEPEPDIVLLRPRSDDYAAQLPSAQDVLLVIEIADTTMAYDRDVKLSIYARHGIPEVWLVDVQSESVSVYLDPSANGYRTLLTPRGNETLAAALLPGAGVRLSELWQ